jgi:hypothetical protein
MDAPERIFEASYTKVGGFLAAFRLPARGVASAAKVGPGFKTVGSKM